MEITNKDNVKKIVTIALASAGGLFLLKKLLFPTKSSLNVKKFEKDVVYLFDFPPDDSFGLQLSPFCLKVETFMKIHNIPFKKYDECLLLEAPKGKLPFIEFNGETIADSEVIIAHLKEKFNIKDELTIEQEIISHSINRCLAEFTYWIMIHYRWIYPPGWKVLRQSLFGGVNFLVRPIASYTYWRYTVKCLYYHGLGRHDEKTLLKFGNQDLAMISKLIGDKPFAFGDKPTTIDAYLYGFLYCIIRPKIDSDFAKSARSTANLAAYCDRMTERYFSDRKFK